MTLTRGLVLGKFMPPHQGHMLLCNFAANYADELVIVVGTQPSEDAIIPGHLRYRWMQQLFPRATVVHLHQQLPQQPDEHPNFWRIWEDALNSVLPQNYLPTHVFASESYANNLANYWNAQPVLVDQPRTIIPVSGTAIRNNPLKYWEYIPNIVRPHYLKRVCLVGPESTGKSMLSENLAKHFNTVFVPEYAKTHIETKGWPTSPSHMETIAQGQKALQRALEPTANRLIICDSDILTTAQWSTYIFNGQVTPALTQAIDTNYDLYLLLAPNMPWVTDIHRNPTIVPRETFFTDMHHELQARSKLFTIINAPTWESRQAQAIQAIQRICVEE